MATFYSKYPAVNVSIPAGGATAANQVLEIAQLTAINSNTTGVATETTLSAINTKTPALGQALAAASTPVVLTAAQITTLTPLSSVSVNNFPATQAVTQSTSPWVVSGAVTTGGLTDAQLRATPVPISGTITANAGTNLNTSALSLEATQSAFSAKSSSADVHEAYDYRAFTYVSTTQKIDTIVYKTGGSGGTTVATQTFGYDGSDRLTSITKT